MEEIIEKILVMHHKLTKKVEQLPNRYLFSKIDINSDYFYGVYGLRGIGKTVLLLQLARKFGGVYFSADYFYLAPFDLYDIIQHLKRKGFDKIFVDEIQVIAEWPKILKTLYDEGEVKIIFSGSSAVKLQKQSADLSRRVILLEMRPLSYREWLLIKRNRKYNPLTLDEILSLKVQHPEVWEFLPEYYREGGLAFSKITEEVIDNMIQYMILKDLPFIREVDSIVLETATKLLFALASYPAGQISYNELSSSLGVSRTLVKNLLRDFEVLGLIKNIYPCKQFHSAMRKQPRVFMTVPFRYWLNKMLFQKQDIGILREDFFVLHVDNLCYPQKTDFQRGGITFEIGGPSKSKEQKADYYVLDIAAFGKKKEIPLYLFGFLY